MPPLLFQSAPNFSEGRRPATLDAVTAAIRAVTGVRLIDFSADFDHNRSVYTLVGEAAPLREALLAAAAVAVREIDLRSHQGVHPRIGAIDVVPIVPLTRGRLLQTPRGLSTADNSILPTVAREAERREALQLAESIAIGLAEQDGVPVYRYEWSALPGRVSALSTLRRGGFDALRGAPLTGERSPDFGPPAAHSSAGACVVGARGPLVACNLNLEAGALAATRSIARRIRAERASVPALAGVRVLGLLLGSRGQAQISLNLTRPDATPLPAIYRYLRGQLAALGEPAGMTEVIGAIPLFALGGEPPSAFAWSDYSNARVLDAWIDTGP